MNTRVIALAFAVVLITSLVAPVAMVAGDDGDTDEKCEPERTLTYDEFRTDSDTVDDVNRTGSAEAITQNTRATVEDSDAFVRIGLENPNSYCVEFELELSEDVVTPSTLGTVQPSDGDTDAAANWEATHDFDADETHTRVTVTLPAESEAQYAPSQARVEMLSWTGAGAEAAESWAGQLTDRIGWGSDLEQREYDLDGEDGERLTVDLMHPETGEPVDEWHATYELEDGTPTPLDDGSDAPVFYREVTNDDDEITGIEITFNEEADVAFTAEPTNRDKLSHSVTAYRSTLSDLFDFNVPLATAGVSTW